MKYIFIWYKTALLPFQHICSHDPHSSNRLAQQPTRGHPSLTRLSASSWPHYMPRCITEHNSCHAGQPTQQVNQGPQEQNVLKNWMKAATTPRQGDYRLPSSPSWMQRGSVPYHWPQASAWSVAWWTSKPNKEPAKETTTELVFTTRLQILWSILIPLTAYNAHTAECNGSGIPWVKMPNLLSLICL